MADESKEEDRLLERRNKQEGKSNSGMGKLGSILFFLAILVFSPFIIFGADSVSNFLGLKSSDSEEIQRTSNVDSGISTQLPAGQGIQTEAPALDIAPAPKAVVRENNEAEKARIAALEAKLKELENQPKNQGITADQLKGILDAKDATFQDELKRQQEARDKQLQDALAQLRVDLSPKGPTAAEIAEQERLQALREAEEAERLRQLALSDEERLRQQQLEDEARQRAEERRAQLKAEAEERKAKAAELRAEQLGSDSVIFDGSEEGEASPGSDSTGANQNVRELSSNEQFLNGAASAEFETSRANDLGDLGQIVVQGTIISAVLETAINTELPGNIRAQVSEPVFSYDGSEVLMPAGTRLIGTFNSDIGTAQTRVLIAWNRAITPSGLSINIGSTGTDRLGRSGTAGNVDNRFIQRFGTAVLISAISAIPSFLSTESESSGTQAANDVANDASGDLADQTESVLEDNLSLPPIIRVPQGEEIRVFVNRDLVFG